MSRVLCTFPGRYGDLLWALPTVRGISEFYKEPVDLLIAGEFASMIPLLEQQPYLARVVADPAWGVSQGWQPPGREDVISPYAQVYHLGYRRWPELPLPFEVWDRVASGFLPRPDLTRPWITVKPQAEGPWAVVCGWSDCWFELKVGLMTLVDGVGPVLPPAGSRWCTEDGCEPVRWTEAAQLIASADVFLGDCSALHVLAVAMGIPVICYEPMEARWNSIFYPVGMDGPQVRLVRGLDGKPTTDSRHTADYLKEALAHAR